MKIVIKKMINNLINLLEMLIIVDLIVMYLYNPLILIFKLKCKIKIIIII